MTHARTTRGRWTVAALATGALVATLGTTGPSGAATPSASPAAAANGARPDPAFGQAERKAAIRAAQDGAERTARQLRMGPSQALRVRDVTRDADGTTHTRYDRTYDALPVVGGDFVVHRTAQGALSTTFGTTKRVFGLSRTSLTATYAAVRTPGTGATKVVYADQHAPVLAWQTTIKGRSADGTPIDALAYTDARTGKRLGTRTRVYNDDATGKSLHSGKVRIQTKKVGKRWTLVDKTRGSHRTYNAQNKGLGDDQKGVSFYDTDNVWGTYRNSTPQTAGVDAAYGAQETWDFYADTYDRQGIRDDGVAPYSRVHYGRDFANAFWSDSCFCMTYGDGDPEAGVRPLVSLDVAGHEMTHGVTANTAGLDYFGDAGGLNESTSDVMGTMVEFEANNTTDPGDYLIGEKVIPGPDGPLRRMDDPTRDRFSLGCWTPTTGKRDPHASSGIGNHAFYLMAEGSGTRTIGGVAYDSPVCTGGAVSPVGRDNAAAVWYRALTTYWVSTSTYPQAADGMVKAATDLYGESSTQCAGITAAWKAVAVPVTASCATPTGTGNDPANRVADPGFEAFDGTWAETQSPGGDPVVVTDAVRGTPAHGGRAYAALGDHYDADFESVASEDTVSQEVTVPATGESTVSFYLQGYTNEDLQSAPGQDPLTVEVDGTPIATYTAFDAYFAEPETWALRKVSVPTSYNGRTVTLTFRSVNDDYANTGWLVDDVALRGN